MSALQRILAFARIVLMLAGAVWPLAITDPAEAQDASAPVLPPTVQHPAQPEAPGRIPAEQSPRLPTPTAPPAPLPALGAPEAQAFSGPESSSLPRDLSPWGMFVAADIVVKGVMIGLAFASLVTWTVWIAKSLQLASARLTLARALRTLSSVRTLQDAAREIGNRRGVAPALVRAAQEEVALSAGAFEPAGGQGLKERVSSRLQRMEIGAARRIGRGTGLLATIGSTAPFVGLFGTVWGIMNSFIGISQAQTTNLAIVAPGIAEALLATAMGLVAAIPAVVIYNMFARATAAYRGLLGDAAAVVERLVSRDLDFGTALPRPVARFAAE